MYSHKNMYSYNENTATKNILKHGESAITNKNKVYINVKKINTNKKTVSPREIMTSSNSYNKRVQIKLTTLKVIKSM